MWIYSHFEMVPVAGISEVICIINKMAANVLAIDVLRDCSGLSSRVVNTGGGGGGGGGGGLTPINLQVICMHH